MRGFLSMTIFSERTGITAEQLWRDLSVRLANKITDDDEPVTIVRMRAELEALKDSGIIRVETVDDEELWLPVFSREKKRETEESKQAALFE